MKITEDHPYYSIYRLEEDEKEIKDLIWGDDNIGEYEVYCRDEENQLIVLKDSSGNIEGMKTETKTGNIYFVDSRHDRLYNI